MTDVPSDKQEKPRLWDYRFIRELRVSYARGQLPPAKAADLSELGVVWNGAIAKKAADKSRALYNEKNADPRGLSEYEKLRPANIKNKTVRRRQAC